tara:strand:- start:2969 stop:3901 length:933 start_codon:yes stop_codon:yes gene_type:complete
VNDARYAFVFPGQGAQQIGMGLDLVASSKAAKLVFDEVDEALGINLSKIVFEGPEEDLKNTMNTQPAILTMSIACLRAMEEILGGLMPSPSFVAGHSLGQYTALIASKSMSLSTAAVLVRERGRLMQYAAELNSGGMAALIGMEDSVIEDICSETDTEISNLNAPGQTVISGTSEAIDKAVTLATERGARRAIPLPVAGAFHSRLMKPAQEGLDMAINNVVISDPQIPIVANSTGLPLTNSEEIKSELSASLCSPVRWRDSIEYMVATAGVQTIYEIGPGKALSGMITRISPEIEVKNIELLENINSLAQ